MAIAHDPRKTREFVPSSDRELPADQRTAFLLRTLDVWAYAELVSIYKGGDLKIADLKLVDLVRIARLGLAGWLNFKTSDGSQAVFVTDAEGHATNETMAWIPYRLVAEIACDIIVAEGVTPTEAAKSPSGSP